MSLEMQAGLTKLQEELANFQPSPSLVDDPFVIVSLEEAILAGLEGNAGVGAVLVDAKGNIAHRDRNRMFHPYFRSDYHAEMVLLTAYEEQIKGQYSLKDYSLYTSLEPCEMCMIRIINSGVSHVYYAGLDIGKGAINGPHELAPHWQNLAKKQSFAQAQCSPRLADMGLEVFELTIGGVVDKLQGQR